MTSNEALALQALSHNAVSSTQSKFCMRYNGIPHALGEEGVRYDKDKEGTVHFTFAFPGAGTVVIKVAEREVALQPSATELGMWTATAHLPTGLHHAFVLVDGAERFLPYLPIVFGFCRPVNYIDVPPPDMDVCAYAMRRHVMRGSVAHDCFDSITTGAVEQLLVYLPPSYLQESNASRRYPVLYLQHGLGENETDWVYAGKINVIADNLIADGQMTEMLIVMGSGTIFVDGTPNVDPFCKVLITDVIPYIDNRYRTLADRDNRAIAGLSMGSMQATRLSVTRQDLFSAVGIFSGFMRSCWSSISTNDDHIDVLRRDPSAYQSAMKVLFRCIGDSDVHLQRFEEDDVLLDELDLTCTRRIYSGPHSWHVWRQAAPDFLSMIFK